MVHAVAARFPGVGEETRLLAEEADFGDVVGDHVRQAVRLLTRHSADEAEVLRRVAAAARDRGDA